MIFNTKISLITRGQSNFAKVARMHHMQLSGVADRLTDRRREHR